MVVRVRPVRLEKDALVSPRVRIRYSIFLMMLILRCALVVFISIPYNILAGITISHAPTLSRTDAEAGVVTG
ncbi:hypothetical protein D3C78_1231900 [compost metagenome]